MEHGVLRPGDAVRLHLRVQDPVKLRS